MKSNEFFKILERKLENLSEKERKEIIFYYDDLIFGAIENGITEETAIANLGNIEEIVDKIMDNYKISTQKIESTKSQSIPFPKGIGQKDLIIDDNQFETINVVTTSSNVIFEKYYEENFKLQHFNSFFSKLSLSIRNNTLYIIENSKRFYAYFIQLIISFVLTAIFIFILLLNDIFNTWYLSVFLPIATMTTIQSLINLLWILLKVDKIIIYIPENKIFNLSINGKYGNYKAKDLQFGKFYTSITSGNLKFINNEFETAYIRASSGNIVLYNNELEAAKKVNKITALATTGNIKISNFICNNLVSKCKSGNIKLRKLASENIEASATTGNIKGFEINSLIVTTKVRSGNIKLKESSAPEKIQLSATSGNIKTINSTFNNAIANVTSGNIKLLKINNSRREFKLDLNARTGRVKVKEFPHNINHFSDNENNTITVDKSIRAEANTGTIKVSFLS